MRVVLIGATGMVGHPRRLFRSTWLPWKGCARRFVRGATGKSSIPMRLSNRRGVWFGPCRSASWTARACLPLV
jgi:hypothetical protein